ncbi:MAG: hypothetical protein U0U70_17185 [Chitinophagaceae bacterium]
MRLCYVLMVPALYGGVPPSAHKINCTALQPLPSRYTGTNSSKARKPGFSTARKKLNKQSHYPARQLNEYKQLLIDPKKPEKKVLVQDHIAADAAGGISYRI